MNNLRRHCLFPMPANPCCIDNNLYPSYRKSKFGIIYKLVSVSWKKGEIILLFILYFIDLTVYISPRHLNLKNFK